MGAARRSVPTGAQALPVPWVLCSWGGRLRIAATGWLPALLPLGTQRGRRGLCHVHRWPPLRLRGATGRRRAYGHGDKFGRRVRAKASSPTVLATGAVSSIRRT